MWDHWMKSEIKDEITRTFIKLGSLPQSIEIGEINTLETFVKSVYFGNSQEIKDSSLNKLRKIQFISSASNDMRKIAPSSVIKYACLESLLSSWICVGRMC